MEVNGNQRKRGGRSAKTIIANDKTSTPQNSELNKVMDVSAVAISPTLEDGETMTNAPAAECRRSSRKKIIKFDVRDLLNKNRKTHKIQIEARIDSNAPTTSKATTPAGVEAANSKTASTTREELLSKQKTFLEKSAIFRRYSISQEHKAPPLPLPMPPLLGKGSDNKDFCVSNTSSTRRLSRTQEFFSNVMIKPKQTTSLIVAQIESNTPSSVTVTKRKSLNKSIEIDKKLTSSGTDSTPVIQHKKRGRPAKIKTETSMKTAATTSVQDELVKKKMSPEKAKNWKEYKACLAQQSVSSKKEEQSIIIEDKAIDRSNISNFDDTLQSDISRSEDDDGNFSGFQTSKDDNSCDSPVLDKISVEKDKGSKDALHVQEFSKNVSKKSSMSLKTTSIIVNLKSNEESNEVEPFTTAKSIKENEIAVKQSQAIMKDLKQSEHVSDSSKNNQTQDIFSPHEAELLISLIPSTNTKNNANTEAQVLNKETQTKIAYKEQFKPTSEEHVKNIAEKRRSTRNSPNFIQKQEVESHNVGERSQTQIGQKKVVQVKKSDDEETDPIKQQHDVQSKDFLTVHKITDTDGNMESSQQIKYKRQFKKDEDTIDTTKCVEEQEKIQEVSQDSDKKSEESHKEFKCSKTSCTEATYKSQFFEKEQEPEREGKTSDILLKATRIVDELTPETKLTASDILLLTSHMPQSQPSTPSEGTSKSFSRTSSSSESENASERSFYSSDPSSTTSSSSPRSFKSGDKLKISIKRISLPKSPSTSSQTSTSEELNNTEVLKRKPPMAKRSKRLQKKNVETLSKKHDSGNISEDKYHKATEIESAKMQLENKTQLDVEENILKFIETEQIAPEISKDSVKSMESTDIFDSKSNESSHMETLAAKEKVFKRKLLRNRKHNSNDDKDEKSDSAISDNKEDTKLKETKIKDQIDITSQELLPSKSKEDKLPMSESYAKLEKVSESGTSVETNDNIEEERRTQKAQKTKQTPQSNYKPPTSEISTTIQDDIITSNKLEPITNLNDNEKEIVKYSEQYKTSKTNISNIEDMLAMTCKADIIEYAKCDRLGNTLKTPTASSESNDKEILTKDLKLKKSSEYIKIESSRHQIKSPSVKTDPNEKEQFQKTAITRSSQEENCSEPTSKLKDTYEIETISKKFLIETFQSTREQTKSPSRKSNRIEAENADKIPSTKSKTNKEEALANDSNIRNEIYDDFEENKTNFENLSTQSPSKSQSKLEDNLLSDQVEIKNLVNTQSNSNSLNEKSPSIDEETQEQNSDKSSRIALTRSKTNKGKESNTEEIIQTSFEKNDPKPEVMQDETAKTSLDKNKSPSEKSFSIVKKEPHGISDIPLSKMSLPRSKKNKEVNFPKKSQIQAELLPDFEVKEKSLQKVSIKHQRADIDNTIAKEIQLKISEDTDEKTECFNEKLKTNEEVSVGEVALSDKSDKIGKITTRRKTNKEDLIKKQPEINTEVITQFSTLDEINPQNVSIPELDTTGIELTAGSNKSATKTVTAKGKTNKAEILKKEASSLEKNPNDVIIKTSIENKTDDFDVTSRTNLTRRKSNKETTSPISPARRKSKKANESISDVHADISKPTPAVLLTAEKITDETPHVLKETLDVVAKIIPKEKSSDKPLEANVVNVIPSSSPELNVTLDKEINTSAKRKSLRNLKEQISPEESSDLFKKSEENLETETKLQKNEEHIGECPKPTKRRGRKSRFKNLYGPEVESETDSNNGQNMPIMNEDEIAKEQTDKVEDKEDQQNTITVPTTGQKTEIETDIEKMEKKDSNINAIPEVKPINVAEKPQANLFTSQIQNVSIETNTLLDILRTVQSNTEAALKASKSPTNINKTDNDIENENTSNVQIKAPAEHSQDLVKTSEESKALSPTRSDTESPSSFKKVNLSPARSDSNSPLTLKKVTPSPTSSNSSSPLTLKKVTRRYERRSRRGEDSTHKTLEETFAEIAAQSSKAVLAAKEYDTNEEQTIGEKPQETLDEISTEPNIEKEEKKETFIELEKSTDIEEIAQKTEEKVETTPNSSQDLDNDVPVSKPDVDEVVVKPNDNIVETQETTKITPARRGRKPKNRSLEDSASPLAVEVKTSPKPKLNTAITTKVEDEKIVHADTLLELDKEETKDETKSFKYKKDKETNENNQIEDLPVSETKPQIVPENTSVLYQTLAECSLKPSEDESKFSKRSNKKREAIGAVMEPVAEVSLNSDKNEVRTPKQTVKKRDSSLSKSETKTNSKKLTKKNKNEEEPPTNLQKEELSMKTDTTTPPSSKRGRKPKNQQPETQQPVSGSKKKNKKPDDEIINEEPENQLEIENEFLSNSLDKSLDEKLAKKKRQKKLKEAFEAALVDDLEKTKGALKKDTSSPNTSSSFGLKFLNQSPPPDMKQSIFNEDVKETINPTCITPAPEPEEDPDPLKDIEKFIADGVNLLKKDYKLDEDSVDDVLQSTQLKITEILEEPVKAGNEQYKSIFNTFETPADTPINTPSATPPPKSPTSIESSTPDENSGVRRSHRIKLITKTPKALVGRGLVRDKERFSIKDDVETKSHYTLDDHLTDLAEVEAKNAKFLKEMEERLSNFQVIKENEYLCERVISREARKMICDCFLTHEEEERGELGCGEDCLNRLLMIECGPDCNVKERCTNKRFQKLLCSPCRVFRTEKKGFGIMADIEILPGEFIMEYVGEVIDTDEFEKRRIAYSQEKNRHYYFMALRSDAIIDATIKGNISRFINHSCDPNAETQKWTVNGELRIGFFSRKSIMPGEEITFNYQYQRYGREAQRCYCESANCTGWIGQEPTSDEGEQLDDDDESEYDDEEEADTSNLLVQDDDEDSDASVADPEEVQKQLELAAAQAEVELAPLQLLEEKAKQEETTTDDAKISQDFVKTDTEEDSKSKFKKLLSKMAEKVAAKQKQNKRKEKREQRKKKSKESSLDITNKLRFLEDPDIEDEVEFLKECGLKNQSDTLRLSRLMVRAKLVQTRLNLLEVLRKGDLPCRRLFLDYHGLRLLHGWMSEDAGNMQIRLSLLQTLETLPIANKTVLTDSKVMQVVRNWCGHNSNLSPNEDSSSSNSNSQDVSVSNASIYEEGSEMAELQKLALKLITTWEGLPEIFRIPKKERIEQMKEHEREADRQYAANAETQENTTATDRYRRDRFGRDFNTSQSAANTSSRFVKPNNGNPHRTTNTGTPKSSKNLSKSQRREMFAAKVARDEAEKRLAEERREFETKCRFFGLDPKKTRTQDMPFCVNPSTGQWFSIERKPITTPPSYAHVQVPPKPKSTDINDYQLPALCSNLPPQWKYAITPQGKIYYYHIKHRVPQWEPPSVVQLHQCELEASEVDSESEITTTAGEDSSDDDDDVLIGMDAAQLKAYIDRKVDVRRQKRYQRLVDERSISPRREEDRIYNQIEVRKYKENKEKIRKRKEEIRRKRAEALRQSSLNMCTLGSLTDATANTNINNFGTENDKELGALPIQDYLLSSDEEVDLKAEVNSPLIDKIVEGDKIVDELDALTTKRQLKRPLPPHRDLNEPSTSSASSTTFVLNALKQEYKKRKLEKKEKRKPKEQDAKYRKNKEKFRCEIAGIIVHHLKPYRKDTCSLGRIQSNEDFNHLARKLTHFVMIKELKYCDSVGQTLVVTESVKSKSREFIKKYMAKYGDVYVKPINDPDFKDIPFTL